MTYDIRLFSQSVLAVPVAQLQAEFVDIRLEVLEGDDKVWTQLLVTTLAGGEICVLDRLGKRRLAKDLDAVRSELDECRPRSGAVWVDQYLRSARTLYACRCLSFGLLGAYGAIPGKVMWCIQSVVGSGIIHAEGQGFSNEDGYQITWEFPDRVTGPRQMAVLGAEGRWQSFEMDLGDDQQRAAFRAGNRPVGVDLLEFN